MTKTGADNRDDSLLADVYLPLGRGLILTYRVPSGREGRAAVGRAVAAGIGRRESGGFIVDLRRGIPETGARDLIEISDEAAVFSRDTVTLAKLVSEYYLCSVPRALGTMLPSSIRRGRRSSTVAVAVPG